ncbi:hypothetical protein [Rhodoferax sp.]|uniref:hypothetical protein n=1 Tax=Rhodoferax sp. TaxID=50421 RepID=UPI002757E018|nr:hypothetical protein [Rhodoferax sp.]
MWSVWSEPVYLYLGQSLALVQAARQPTVVLRPSATLPLERVLQQVGEHLPRASRLHVSLSGALCPAFDVALPQGVRRWHERQAIAQHWVADSLGLATGELLCELDARAAGLGAALPTATLAALQQWAKAQGHRIGALQPLWAQATQCAAAAQAGVRGVLVQEPDAVTVLAEPGNGTVQTLSLPGAPNATAVATRLAQWQVSMGLTSDRFIRLGFDAKTQTIMGDGPQAWRPHWYKL